MAAREIKTTLAIDGEQQFKRSINEAYSAMKVLGSELKLNTAEFGKNAESMDGLAKRGDILNQEMAQQQQIVDALSKAVEESSAKYGENSKQADEYRVKLNNASAALIRIEDDFKKNTEAMETLRKQSKDGEEGMGSFAKKAQEAAEALKGKLQEAAKNAASSIKTKLTEALKNAGSVMKGAFVGAAGIAAGAIKSVGSAAIEGGKQLLQMAKDSAETGDRIATMSQQLGMSTENFQQWEYVLSQNGASIDVVRGGMETLTAAMASAMDGNEEAQETFKSLGISMKDLEQSSREDIFEAVVSGLQGMSDETDKAATAATLLGGASTDLAPLLNQTAESTAALKQEASDMGLVMSEQAVQASSAFTGAQDTLSRVFEGIKTSIGSQLLPGLTQVTEGLTGMVTGAAGASEDFKQGITNLIQQATGLLQEWIPRLLEMGTQILQALVDGLLQSMPFLMEALPQLIETITTFVVDNLPQLLEAGIKLIIELAKGLVQAIPQLVEALPQILDAIIDTLLEAVPDMLNIGVDFVKGLWDGIKSMIDWLWDKVTGWIDGLVSGVMNLLGINSPSKVMRDKVGVGIPEGIAVGILAKGHLVDEAMAAIMPDTKKLSASIQAEAELSTVLTARPARSAPAEGYPVSLSEGVLTRLIEGFREVLSNMGNFIVVADDREVARYIRKVVPQT